MPTLICPDCGHWGPATRSELAFEYLARDGLVALRRCRMCGAYLLVRFTLLPTVAEAETVPEELLADILREHPGLARSRARGEPVVASDANEQNAPWRVRPLPSTMDGEPDPGTRGEGSHVQVDHPGNRRLRGR